MTTATPTTEPHEARESTPRRLAAYYRHISLHYPRAAALALRERAAEHETTAREERSR
jgi:hypothetical protein